MSSYNKVQILGNVGQEPESRFLSNGEAVVNLSIATSEKWTDKNGEKKEKTEWHRVVFFRKQAELISKYVTKGSKVFLDGKLQTRKWEDKSGVTKYTTEIIGQSISFLDKKEEAQNSAIEVAKNYEVKADTSFATDDIPF